MSPGRSMTSKGASRPSRRFQPRRLWLAVGLLEVLPATGAYRLQVSPDGAALSLEVGRGATSLLKNIGYRASTNDGVAFATERPQSVKTVGATTGISFRLTGPLAEDAAIDLQLTRRSHCVDVELRARYTGSEVAFNPWTSGIAFSYAEAIAGATAAPVTKYVKPTGRSAWEVAGDTLYRDLDAQVRQVLFESGTLAIVTGEYDADWIHGNDAQRAAFARAGLPKKPPYVKTVRFSLFSLPPGPADPQLLADTAAGRPWSIALASSPGPCARPGDSVEFAVEATRVADTAPPATLTLTVHDYYGVRRAHREVRLGERGTPRLRARVPSAARGILFADASITYPPGTAEAQYARTTVAVLPERPASEPDPGSPFGMAAMLAAPERFPDQPDRDTVLAAMQRVGVRWLRSGSVPVAGELTDEKVAQARQSVGQLARYGISPHVQVAVTLPLPEDPGPFVARFTAGLSRLSDVARHIEVGNELNHGTSPQDYITRLLRPVSEAMRGTAPSHPVMSMGLGGVHRSWLDPFVEAGGLDLVDVLSVHPGSFPRAPEFYEGWRGWVFRTQMLDACRAAREHGDKAVWITEAYAPNPPERSGLDVRTSADYLVRTYICALALGVQVCEWYQFQDGTWYARTSKPDDVEHHFGIVHTDLTPKPAYVAYGTMTEQLAGARYVGRLDLGADDLYGVRFSRGEERVDVVWSYREKHETDVAWWPPEKFEGVSRRPGEPWETRWSVRAEVRVRRSAVVEARDIMGNPVPVRTEGEEAVLPLTGSPLYVRGLGDVPLLTEFWKPID